MKAQEVSDLLCISRRRSLSKDEARSLASWVAESEEARVLSGAMKTFDAESAAQPDDDGLMARIAGRSVATRRRGVRPRAMLLLVAAVLLVAGTALSQVGSFRQRLSRLVGLEDRASTVAETGASPRAPDVVRPASSEVPTIEVPASPEPPGASAFEASPPRAETDPARRDGAHSPATETRSAPELFEQANARRVAGDGAGAATLYRELVLRHPGSAEAVIANLALGKLLLAKGQASEALSAFRRCAMAGGPLSNEARWGEAEALRRLRRSSEERRVLQELVKRDPQGVYGTAARKRLEQ